MSIFVSTFMSFLMCLVGTGCVGEIEDINKGKTPYITFEVPEGWEIVDEQLSGGSIGAILRTEKEDYLDPDVNMEFYPYNIKGGEEEAKKRAEETYQAVYCHKPPCAYSEFKTIDLPSGEKIYAAFGSIYPKSWYTRDLNSDSSWTAHLNISKAGYILDFTFSDRPDLYIDELDVIVRTMKVEFK
jgi:hypothetical protein